MTYNKPNNITYTEMAMYFDEHIRDPDRDDSLLYQYVYHLAYMLASKSRYFHRYEDYDHFALYAATKIYLRALNQVAGGDNAGPIKSILNYTKAVLYPLKVDYQKEAYEEILNPEIDGRLNGEKLRDNLNDAIQSDYQQGLNDEMYKQLEQLPTYIKDIVEETPYKGDQLTTRRLYMSVLISFVRGITISNSGIAKIKRREEKDLKTDDTLFKMLEKEKLTSAALWRLPESMLSYVDLLTNKVRKRFGQDLIELKQSYMLKEAELGAIVMSAYNTDPRDANEET